MSTDPNRLRSLRESAGLSRYKLAIAMDVDPSTIYKWEKGQAPIDDDRKAQLAEFFGVTRSHLMGWDDVPAADGSRAVAS